MKAASASQFNTVWGGTCPHHPMKKNQTNWLVHTTGLMSEGTEKLVYAMLTKKTSGYTFYIPMYTLHYTTTQQAMFS